MLGLGAPQIILVALIGIKVGVALAKDGQARTGKHSIKAGLVNNAVLLTLLWWGGFFG